MTKLKLLIGHTATDYDTHKQTVLKIVMRQSEQVRSHFENCLSHLIDVAGIDREAYIANRGMLVNSVCKVTVTGPPIEWTHVLRFIRLSVLFYSTRQPTSDDTHDV